MELTVVMTTSTTQFCPALQEDNSVYGRVKCCSDCEWINYCEVLLCLVSTCSSTFNFKPKALYAPALAGYTTSVDIFISVSASLYDQSLPTSPSFHLKIASSKTLFYNLPQEYEPQKYRVHRICQMKDSSHSG